MITLQQWIDSETKRMERFKVFYLNRANLSENIEFYPDKLPPEERDEQYQLWSDTQK